MRALPSSVWDTHPLAELRSVRAIAVEIALVSFVILFQELTLIRWTATQVRVVAYFPNVVLMSAFLGLGLGCLLSRRRLSVWLWPLSVLLLSLAAIGMSRIAFTQESTSEHLWLLYLDLHDPPVVQDTRIPILGIFALSVLTFVPLGHFLAVRIAEMTRRRATLKGYALDLLGSLLGTVAFSVLSYFWMPPVVWFTAFVAAGTWLFSRHAGRSVLPIVLSGVVVVLAVLASTRSETFSPYYGISTMSRGGLGTLVLTNGSLHQYAAPLTSPPDTPGLTDQDRLLREGYPVPYRLLKSPPKRVLVLGAGTGNDVAVALAQGAEEVDAVEIDPAISRLGLEIHPNKPYSDSRVRIFNDDARSFLEKADRKYDLVVFGTLDSMTRLSALSTVRLDNFVYTREALEAARGVLSGGGGVAMYFMVKPRYIAERLARLHHDVFGTLPAVVEHPYFMFNLVLMSGPAFDHVPRRQLEGPAMERWKSSVEPSTDDWPYLYLKGRGFTPFYVEMILVVALLAVLSILGVSKEMRSGAVRGQVDFEMLCLGGAFLLLETKSVTEMNLAWGATWLTNAVVFGSILLMLLAATLLMDWRPISSNASVSCLAVTLLIAYFSPVHLLLGLAWPVKLFLSTVVVGSPIFFASTLFAVRFGVRVRTDVALGWNLLGAVLGGLLEFSSMLIGIRNLSLLALALYLSSTVAGARLDRKGDPGTLAD